MNDTKPYCRTWETGPILDHKGKHLYEGDTVLYKGRRVKTIGANSTMSGVSLVIIDGGQKGLPVVKKQCPNGMTYFACDLVEVAPDCSQCPCHQNKPSV